MPTLSTPTRGFLPTGKVVGSKKNLQRTADVDPRLTRSYYFDNRLLTEKDLNRDQIYLDSRLREVGQALGYGVVNGLEASFNKRDFTINVKPGVGVSSAGRVLELSRSLTLDLRDSATIEQFNDGQNSRLERGIYALLVQYIEYGTDVAEVFPGDLTGDRGFDFDLISEGVKISMVKLSVSLSQQNSLQVRTHLMTKFYNDPSAAGEIPEDAVALGVLAVNNDRPLWFDQELLRQPLKSHRQLSDIQADFYRQYQHIFSDLMAYRASGSRNRNFAARDYFSVLPPVGSLPKESVSPVDGRQSFFPELYNVSITPVRKAELELLKQESLQLPPLNLSLEEAQDIIVLAPLSNTDFGHYAQRLQQHTGGIDSHSRKLPSLNLLRLRLYPKRPVHTLDTDRVTWEAIWDAVIDDDLIYIRRPQRTAETSISGIVLAQGIELPATPPPSAPSPSDNNLLQDEGAVFLNRINLASLSAIRSSENAQSIEAVESLVTEFDGQADITQHIAELCLRIEREYDDLLWQTILAVALGEQLQAFSTELFSQQDEGAATPEIINGIGGRFGLPAQLLEAWSDVA